MPTEHFTRPPGVWMDPPPGRRAAKPARIRPAFLIVGAMRSGTTFLYRCLTAHPRILPALRKELHYFDFQYHKGQAWYLAHFPPRTAWTRHRGALCGEASPNYLMHPLAATRAQRFDPKLRAIAVLRDPVSRAFSQYRRNRARGEEPLGFEAALAAEAERLEAGAHRFQAGHYSRAHHVHSYVERGRYAWHLQAWLDAFGTSQVLIVDAAALFAAPADTVAAVFAFLGLPPLPACRMRLPGPANAQPRQELPADVRRRAAEYFHADQRRLAALLHAGVPCVGTPVPDASAPLPSGTANP